MAGQQLGAGEPADWRPAGARGTPIGARPDWAPAAEKPVANVRRFKLAAFGGATLALVGAFVALVLYLRPTPPPVLIVVTANPAADAGRLDVPLDPFGYLGGERLVRWGQEFRDLLPADIRGKAPSVEKFEGFPPTERAFAENAAAAVGRAKSAVIYVGLHSGCDPDGPYIAGPEGARLRVLPLLDELSHELSRKTVVVIFDSGRLPANGLLGRVTDTFVQRLEEHDAKIAELGNVIVLTGTAPHERGWESEEWQRTALAHALVEGLTGHADAGGDSTVTAAELLDYVAQRTEEWSGANRPLPQKPCFFPADGWRAIAETMPVIPRVARRPDEEPPGLAAGLPKELKLRFEECEQLARRQPSPAVFAPRRWRRYRELLLRYEMVARSGEAVAAGALDRLLQAEKQKLDAATIVPLPLSQYAASPLPRAAGNAGEEARASAALVRAGNDFLLSANAIDLDRFREQYKAVPAGSLMALRADFTRQQLLKLAAAESPPAGLGAHDKLLRLLWGDGAVRPPEVQLALILADFYRPDGAAEKLPGRGGIAPWQRALDLRRAADESAVGAPAVATYPYAETVWPAIRGDILAGDAARQRAEDALFASPDVATGPATEADQREADASYRRAAGLARRFRETLVLRDEALADLPYLAAWSAENAAEAPDAALKLWSQIHQITATLDQGNDPPDALVREAGAAFDALRRRYADQFLTVSLEKLQERWQERERLLAVPPLTGAADSARRLNLVQVNRDSSAYFDSADNKTAPTRSAAAGLEPDERARRLARLAVRAYGDEILDAQNRQGGVAAASAALEARAAEAKGDGWAGVAEQVGQWLEQHAALLDAAKPTAIDAPEADRLRAERFSRLAPQFGPRESMEPAEENRRFRWRRLLAGLAHRVTRDHYTDAGGKEYFPAVARALLADADAMAPRTAAPPAPDGAPGRDLAVLLPPADAAELARLVAAKPLEVVNPATSALPWTTEREREVPFELRNPVLPKGARPSSWGGVSDATADVRLARSSAGRALVPDAGQTAQLPVALESPDTASSADGRFSAWRKLFFRGQWSEATAPVRLSRVPDVVLTQTPPVDDAPLLGFRGPDDLDLGAVAVVMDYSPSMNAPVPGGTRLSKSLEALEKVLAGLPNGTKIVFRGFGVRGSGRPDGIPGEKLTVTGENATYDEELAVETVNWRVVEGNIKPLMRELRSVKQGPDTSLSPIVRAMKHAADDLKALDLRPPAGRRPRLMLVLTDGEDNSFYSNINAPTPAEKNALRASLQAALRGSDTLVRLVMIADAGVGAKQIQEVCDQFRGPLEASSPPGGVTVVRDYPSLAREMTDLLRPRIRLKPGDADGGLSRRAQGGVPLSHDNVDPLEPPRWSPALAPGPYHLRLRQEPRDSDPVAEVAAGDRLLVRVGKRDGETFFERVLWGDELARSRHWAEAGRAGRDEVRWQDKAGPWLLSAAGHIRTYADWAGKNAYERNRDILDIVAAVENHRQTAPPPTEPIRHLRPAAVWWQIDPAQKLLSRAPLYAWPEYGHPAPAWRLRRWDWRSDGNALPATDLQMWASADAPPAVAGITLTKTPRSFDGQTPDGRKFVAQVAWEPHDFVTHPRKRPTRLPSLVVRAYFADGQPATAPLVARLENFGRTEEVRFFAGSGATSCYFSDRTPDDCDGKKLELLWYGGLGGEPARLLLPSPGSSPRVGPIDSGRDTPYSATDGCTPSRNPTGAGEP